MDKRSMIEDLKASRADSRAELSRILAAATRSKRDLSTGETTRFDALETDVKELDERIKELTDQVTADEAAANTARKFAFGGPIQRGAGNSESDPWATASARATSTGANPMTNRSTAGNGEYRPSLPGQAYARSASISVVSEPAVYQRFDASTSYFRDLHLVAQNNDRDAMARLQRNERMADDRAKRAGEVRAVSTTNGTGGEFSPPGWLESAYIELARPGRVLADLMDIAPLPPGVDTLIIPRVNTGASTAVQSVQNSAVSNTDITTSSYSSPIQTIAGQQVVSLQLLEQGAINVDEVIFSDLVRDYSMRLDNELISGSGTGGHLTGLLSLSGAQQIAWTQTTPSLSGAGGFYSTLASAISAVHTARFAPPDAIVMHPRRWMWLAAQSDLQGRPLVVPNSPINAMGSVGDIVAEGPAGTILNLPVYLDPNLPTNLGAGTNQDPVLVVRRSDLMLWEGRLKAESFQQTYASNLSVLLRVYNYVAAVSRYPSSVAVINGTGSKTPGW